MPRKAQTLPPSSQPLVGRRVAITGASRGIGAAAALGLAAQGAEVALLHHPSPEMSELALAVRESIQTDGGRAATFGADLRDPDQIQSTFTAVADELGAVDVLINNAAVSRVGPWDAVAVEAWDELMAVNVRAAWLCARAVTPGMRAAGWGRVVNVSSIEYRLGTAVALAYVTSKAGLLGLTRALASALGPDGICVNAILPGAIRTPLEVEAYGGTPEFDRGWIERQAVKRRGTPDDLVGLFGYLASPASDFTTGQFFTVDGGATFG